VLSDVLDGEPGLPELRGRTPRGQQLYIVLGEELGQGHDASLVRDGDKRAGDLAEGLGGTLDGGVGGHGAAVGGGGDLKKCVVGCANFFSIFPVPAVLLVPNAAHAWSRVLAPSSRALD